MKHKTVKEMADRKLDHLANLIRAKRKEIGMTQVTLAKYSGVSERYIVMLEGRKRKGMSVQTLNRVLQCLDIKWAELDML
ncbi:MAG: hypothetical protein CL868_06470 [Cytophagaceae bacterium]|nr:hypothetical protein [Cytophagaceae bacterium]|tara:strand:+ start:25175 stop:25414 length:240 start_codon:yes stop_codon:yes gene_type:complete